MCVGVGLWDPHVVETATRSLMPANKKNRRLAVYRIQGYVGFKVDVALPY